MSSLDRFASDKLVDLEQRALRRTLIDTARTDGIWVERNGRRLLSFSCNDYLNLSHHPAVKRAAIEAVEQYGAGAGASRLVTGNHPLLSALEARLAAIKGTEAACVFGSGYLANTGIIPTLVGPGDLVLADELAHACIMAGSRLSGAEQHSFRHNDLSHLEEILTTRRRTARHAVIATDGVFSMDGDLAPLPELAALAERHDCWLLSDDAHGIGVIGGGRGSSFAHGRSVHVPLQMGTLSKALGSYGGYLCASRPVIDLIKTRARTLVYSTGLPPASAAAALAALDVIAAEPDFAGLPLAKARRFTERLGLPPATSPIVPIFIGDAAEAVAVQRRLEEDGFLIVAIRPPTVPPGTARLRIAFTAGHPNDAIDRLAEAIREKALDR